MAATIGYGSRAGLFAVLSVIQNSMTAQVQLSDNGIT